MPPPSSSHPPGTHGLSVRMPRCSLTFKRRETEGEFMRWIVGGTWGKLDSEFLCASVVLAVAHFPQFITKSKSWYWPVALGMLVAWFAGAAVAWRRMSLEELTARRTGMVLTTRVVTLVFCWILEAKWTPFPVTSLGAVCLAGVLVTSVLLAGCLRLKFQHHFPFQLAVTFALLFSTTKGPCAALMDSRGASTATILAGRLDSWAKAIMTTMYGRRSTDPLVCPCLHVMAFLHVFVVLIVGSYVLWKLESESRRAFVQTMPEERRMQERLVVGFADTLYTRLMHAFLFVVGFAVTWELNYFLVHAIDSWEM